MATQGAFTIFNKAKLKVLAGGGSVNLASDAFKAVLCTSSQSLTAAFAGASTNAQYSDLTAELTTANGYTAGGFALTGPMLTLVTATVTWDTSDAVWTLTGGITFKYFVIYDNTTANKDLVTFCDMDTGGGSVSPSAGTLTVAIAGIETFS